MYLDRTVTLCIPTLSQYEMLDHCIETASNGILKPDKYVVMDNGGLYTYEGDLNVEIVSYGYNIGVAKSWNYFINNVPEIRIISNDDIQFHPDTIKAMVENYDNHSITSVRGIAGFNAFSLFIFPDFMKERIGLFDESISPNYAYYEDNDYVRRMELKGYGTYLVDSNVGHFGSATLRHMNPIQTNEHHKKFELARKNYISKWGGLPGEEKFDSPFSGLTWH